MIETLPTQEQVDRIAGDLAPDVVRIRFAEGLDWSDDPAFYFRVVLSDDASRRDRLGEVIDKVEQRVSDELLLKQAKHLAYFRFRSQSEQANLRDAAWA